MVVLTEAVSSSSSTHNYEYDVFLSFRGADTRNSFTDHLYAALKDADFKTYLDDEETETGKELKPELESAIKASRASIIVLSKNYASSTWCLEELVLILEQYTNSNQIVIPVFYHVDPADVRKQQGTFRDAMAKHKQKMEEERTAEKRSQLGQKMESWKKALSRVANLKGRDANNRKETELIEEIISDIRLTVPLISNAIPLIGRDSYINFITSWLTDRSCHNVDILTIIGMSGIGKTSLAKYVFDLHRDTVHRSGTFQKSSFLEGISKRCTEKFDGLLDLTKQLYRDISKKNSKNIRFVCVSMIEKALAGKKVFLVLDDIDSLDQLNALLGREGFHPGSKIIITTKHRSLTESYALFNSQIQPKHTKVCLEGLYETKAVELLCTHAFKCKKPKEGYQEVSKELVTYCDGHPLALKVLGESLHNRDVPHWKECIQRLKKGPDSRIQKALHMSFNSLPSEDDRELFKHIACFFVGVDRSVTETILKACDIEASLGITNLFDRCLLSIGLNNKLMMHQLIQELGRDLVRQESPHKPWKRSRLWCHEESFKVLKQKKGKGSILGLSLDMRMINEKRLGGSSNLETDCLSQMDDLLLLQLNYLKMNGSYENFPKELRWLCMHGFLLKSLPSGLPMKTLVVLDLSYSNIESFSMRYGNPLPLESREKLLTSLKILDLSFCEHLHSLGGFLELPELERLIVRNCISLLEVCESIEHCVTLVFIDLSYCYKLRKLPRSMRKLKMVETLLLDGCTSLESRIQIGDMDSLEIIVANPDIYSQTSLSASLEAIPSVLTSMTIYLPCSLVSLSLRNNNMSNESFPDDFSGLSMLKKLYLDGNPIVSMPNCVRDLQRLEELTMYKCGMLTSIKHPPRTLRNLSLSSDQSLVQKIIFDSEMSPLDHFGVSLYPLPSSSFQIDGMVKIQPMTDVEKLLPSLGWTDLGILTNKLPTGRLGTPMYYEFGIFSITYGAKEMPNWITNRSEGESISFSIPSSPMKLQGLNFCYMEMQGTKATIINGYNWPVIKISNITKCHTWFYKHYPTSIMTDRGMWLVYLSHWMFGMNEIESGDRFMITVINSTSKYDYVGFVQMCGVGFVYDDARMKEAEENVLDYYKSWNHIIGGDLSHFQTTTGEYLLDFTQFCRYGLRVDNTHLYFIDGSKRYKERRVAFKAFSPRKRGSVGIVRYPNPALIA